MFLCLTGLAVKQVLALSGTVESIAALGVYTGLAVCIVRASFYCL